MPPRDRRAAGISSSVRRRSKCDRTRLLQSHRVTCSFLKKTFIRSRETPVVRRVCSVLMSHRKEAQKGGRGPRAARRP
ncbi:hypothetical protein AGIG_G21379 [Arapaima gigas]